MPCRAWLLDGIQTGFIAILRERPENVDGAASAHAVIFELDHDELFIREQVAEASRHPTRRRFFIFGSWQRAGVDFKRKQISNYRDRNHSSQRLQGLGSFSRRKQQSEDCKMHFLELET